MRLSRRRRIFASLENVFGNSAVNENKTGVPYYDNFLNEKDSEYMRKNKNRIGHIEDMSPNEYYRMCATQVFDNTSVDRLKRQRVADYESIDSLQDILDKGGQFWLPYVNIADKNQEGLHRMMVLGDNFGWDTKFPVLVVESADPRVDEINEVWRQLNRAQSNARDYLYSRSGLPQDFIEQAQYELERYDGETDLMFKVIDEDKNQFTISAEGYEDEINFTEWYSNLRLTKSETKDEEDDTEWDIDKELEGLDLEDIEDYLFKSL